MSRLDTAKRSGYRLAHDPLLARIDVLHELSVVDRLNWIGSARSLLIRKRSELVAGGRSHDRYSEIATQGLVEIIDIRLEALDKLYRVVLREHEPDLNDAEGVVAADS
jgi:hypothetical protein